MDLTSHESPFSHDVVVIGGGGHVGLPLAIALADAGASVLIYDIGEAAVQAVNDGRLPFDEPGAAQKLKNAVAGGHLKASTDPEVVGHAENVVVVIGTPVDEHLNPDPQAIPRALGACIDYFRDGQLVVLRSTVYPGVTARVERLLSDLGIAVDVAFCPERIAEGKAMEELFSLPQIVSARTPEVRARAAALFGHLTEQTVLEHLQSKIPLMQGWAKAFVTAKLNVSDSPTVSDGLNAMPVISKC